jgi:hypothetical protein
VIACGEGALALAAKSLQESGCSGLRPVRRSLRQTIEDQ